MKNFSASAIFALAFFASATSANAAFHDVSADHANSTAIEFVQNENIVAGYSDGNFRPDATINRAELTKIIIESQFTAPEIENCATGNNFPDVQNSDWFAPHICLAKNKNIVSGYSDSTFRPANPVNFAEAAKIISGAFNFETTENEIWYRPFVDALGKRKAIPTTITSFEKNISRGEMAEMIWRLKSGNAGTGSVDFAGIEKGAETENWKIFRDEKYGFSFKYPSTIFEEVATNTIQHSLKKFHKYSVKDGSDLGLAKDIIISFQKDSAKCDEIRQFGIIAEPFEFENITGLKYETGAEGEGAIYFCAQNDKDEDIFLIERWFLSESYSTELPKQEDFISSTEQKKLFDQILATFEFIE